MKNNKELLYKLCLIVCSIIWGSTFVVIKDATNTMSSGFINASRFTIAAVILLAVYFKKIKNINKSELKHGIIMGVALFGGYYLQVLGMEYGSTAGKCAFLSATFCVMVPFLSWGVFKKVPDKYSVIAAILCIIGVALVSIENGAHITVGDGIILISAFFYAVNIMFTSEFSAIENNDTIILAFLQIAVVGILSWIKRRNATSLPCKSSYGSYISRNICNSFMFINASYRFKTYKFDISINNLKS